MGNAAGNNPGFSRASTGEQKQWTFLMGDGFTLLRIETVEIEHIFVFSLYYLLIKALPSARLRAMFRLIILLISLVWASLLLISWSGATPPQDSAKTDVSISVRS